MPIFIFAISVNAQNTTIGDVDMGEISNSEAFNQVKNYLESGKVNCTNNLELLLIHILNLG